MKIRINIDNEIEISEAYVGIVFRNGKALLGICERDDGWDLQIVKNVDEHESSKEKSVRFIEIRPEL